MSSGIKCVQFFLLLFPLVKSADPQLGACQPKDFHWEYTECDSEGGRWKVQVPHPNTCVQGAPLPPERGKSCDFTCDPGQFLDVGGDQQCKACPAGKFSLGGGVLLEDWDHMPAGLVPTTELFSFRHYHSYYPLNGEEEEDDDEGDSQGADTKANATDNCQVNAWTPKGRYISSLPGDCVSLLSYTVTLVKPGKLQFTYQHTDETAIFSVQIKNSQCQSYGDDSSEWPEKTEKGEWSTNTMNLKTGPNTIVFKTLGFSSSRSGIKKPINIKSISISGIAYTQECTLCRAGTVSKGEGKTSCEECPADHFAPKGSAECIACKLEEYSIPGSESCKQKPTCTEKDYFEYHSPCKDNMTKVMYDWIKPKICIGGTLPASGQPQPCPPCNPGMSLVDGKCKFCPANQFSDGNSGCETCAENTAPIYGLTYQWWQNLPIEANVSSECLAMSDYGCSTKVGWDVALNNIHTQKGHADDAFLVLTLDVGGFKTESMHTDTDALGQISFIFQLECTGPCSFVFMQQTEDETKPEMLKTWTGNMERHLHTFDILTPGAVQFIWAYQKSSDSSYFSRAYPDDRAIMYSVNVTNTLTGAAVKCQSCPQGTDQAGCIPCPDDSYIERETSRCRACPQGTIVQGRGAWGVESCKKCGEGLVPHKEQGKPSQCVTSCKYSGQDGKNYDFTKLAGIMSVEGSRLFTTSGLQYYHAFNLSLCGGSYNFPKVACYDNVSAQVEEGPGNITKGVENLKKHSGVISVESVVCRSTIIPPKEGDRQGVVSAQPNSIGDRLVQITNNETLFNISQRMEVAGFKIPDDERDDATDVHFLYASDSPTMSCPSGRSTLISLRCDTSAKGMGSLQLPPKCADGTCDGCNFHLMWSSRHACPVCTDEVYKEVRGECVKGEQEIHYIGPKYCREKAGSKLKKKCSVLPFWLQVTLVSMFGVGFMLCVLIVYCWKKNKKLEYKYMKLMTTSSGSKDGELPAAETCALSDDEDDQYDAVQFKEGSGRTLFSKLKSIGKKKFSQSEEDEFFDGDNPFESFGNSDSIPLT